MSKFLRVDIAYVQCGDPLAACVRAWQAEDNNLTDAEIARRCGVTNPAVARARTRSAGDTPAGEYKLVDKGLLQSCGPWVAVMEAFCMEALSAHVWREATWEGFAERTGWSYKTAGKYLTRLEDMGRLKARRKQGQAGGHREYKLMEVRG